MALGATIYKLSLDVSDMTRNVYGNFPVTIAKHPSETDERVMVRAFAFGLFAHERLEFGRGISTDDEPALWLKDYTGDIIEWIDVGLPDERLLRKACGRAARVSLFVYGGKATQVWWSQNENALARLRNLQVIEVPFAATQALAKLADRNMALSMTIDEGSVLVAGASETIEIEPIVLKACD
jgi:uncharacterized protein YaeQ